MGRYEKSHKLGTGLPVGSGQKIYTAKLKDKKKGQTSQGVGGTKKEATKKAWHKLKK